MFLNTAGFSIWTRCYSIATAVNASEKHFCNTYSYDEKFKKSKQKKPTTKPISFKLSQRPLQSQKTHVKPCSMLFLTRVISEKYICKWSLLFSDKWPAPPSSSVTFQPFPLHPPIRHPLTCSDYTYITVNMWPKRNLKIASSTSQKNARCDSYALFLSLLQAGGN